MNITANHNEIVAINYKGCTIIRPGIIASILELGEDLDKCLPISRAMARMMSKLDVGSHWDEIAKLPTLFKYDWNGKIEV